VDTPITRRALANYYQDINTMDKRLGETMAMVDRHGLATNTVLIYTTDQGAEWPRCKWTLYDSGLRVPFIVRWPGVVKSGSVCNSLVSLVDVAPTFAAIGGGQAPSGIDGVSFVEILRGRGTACREDLFATHTGDGTMNLFPQRAIRDARYEYILNLHPERSWTTHFTKVEGIPDSHAAVWQTWVEKAAHDPAAARLVDAIVHHPAEELFDTQSDPYELTNLVSRAEMRPVAERLRQRLGQVRKQLRDQED
jgi:N-sulfoglucosamine sulfohydrolase